MTIFNILKDIIYTKSGTLINNQEFNDVISSPYILQRWISMESTQNAYLVSETTNKLCKGLLEDKELWYKLYITLIDKKPYKKIKYLKRDKQIINEDENQMIEKLGRIYEMSKTEIKENMTMVELIHKGVE